MADRRNFMLAGIVANHYYNDISMLLRTLCWFLILAAAGFVASTTQKGRWTIKFFRDARVELRKVVWPTREETMQTTCSGCHGGHSCLGIMGYGWRFGLAYWLVNRSKRLMSG